MSYNVYSGYRRYIYASIPPFWLLENKLCPLLTYSVGLPYMAVYSNYNTIKSFLYLQLMAKISILYNFLVAKLSWGK